MKWLEMIRVRSSPQGVDAAKQYLAVHMPSFRGVKYVRDAAVLSHALYEGDLAVILTWEAKGAPAKTREGLFLANYFMQYGPVDHAIWTLAFDALGSCHEGLPRKESSEKERSS